VAYIGSTILKAVYRQANDYKALVLSLGKGNDDEPNSDEEERII